MVKIRVFPDIFTLQLGKKTCWELGLRKKPCNLSNQPLGDHDHPISSVPKSIKRNLGWFIIWVYRWGTCESYYYCQTWLKHWFVWTFGKPTMEATWRSGDSMKISTQGVGVKRIDLDQISFHHNDPDPWCRSTSACSFALWTGFYATPCIWIVKGRKRPNTRTHKNIKPTTKKYHTGKDREQRGGLEVNVGDTSSSSYGPVADQVRHCWNFSRRNLFCHKKEHSVYWPGHTRTAYQDI
jgi:hypothetical protein